MSRLAIGSFFRNELLLGEEGREEARTDESKSAVTSHEWLEADAADTKGWDAFVEMFEPRGWCAITNPLAYSKINRF